MNEELLDYLLKGIAAVNAGPDGREVLCTQMEHEFNTGNIQHSVFYQVMMLFQAFDLRFAHEAEAEEEERLTLHQLRANMNDWEKEDLPSNPLLQYAFDQLWKGEVTCAKPAKKPAALTTLKTTNFLYDVRTPAEGLKRIEFVSKQMPKEWTIIQLCKGPRPDTTYSIFPKIYQSSSSIYLTLLRHARSTEYPEPICLRFSTGQQEEQSLFNKFATIAERFKQDISVNGHDVHSPEFKMKYWQNLSNLEEFISVRLHRASMGLRSEVLCEFKNLFFPWLFLFTGIPVDDTTASISGYRSKAFLIVDVFCNANQWAPKERVLLSLAALHASCLCRSDFEAICGKLAPDDRQSNAALTLLLGLQASASFSINFANDISPVVQKQYPCILIVDERLDHFYWETLNVNQEFSRVSSLHCLWRLQQFYKANIRSGYLMLNIESGGCVLNPDDNLANTEMRMKSFLKYWLPHWLITCRQKLTTEDLCNEFFNRSCFVYAGHGSGLQYFNCKQLTRQQMNGVVFLFGCDSSRLRSNGLYSELIGAHRYYHAALCPAVVGTLLPGLDANMDSIAAQILSHWIAPTSKNITPWTEIDPRTWTKEGLIKAKSKAPANEQPTVANTTDYLVGSLCEVLSRVHQRCYDKNHYNTIGYVCRGLPVWNYNARPFPK